MTVAADGTKGWYLPTTAAEWSELVDGLTGWATPSSVWLCQDASGNLADAVGTRTGTATGSILYQQATNGWTRTGVRASADNGANYFITGPGSISSVATTSGLLLEVRQVVTTPSSGFRGFSNIGSIDYVSAQLMPEAKARARHVGATSNAGHVTYTDVIVVTKLDHARDELAVYCHNGTTAEIFKPTWAVPTASTQLILMGDGANGTDSLLLYAAYWAGAAAEMSDEDVLKMIARIFAGAPTTRAAWARGSTRDQWVLCIDGYDKLLTDGDIDKAVAAHAGTDWTQGLGGLVVEARPEQTADPNNPFANMGGRCIVHVYDDHAQTFGIETHRRGAGSWTTLRETIDRNDTALAISSNAGFAASGDAHIGTECIQYSGTTSSTMTVTVRGKYTAVGCHASGSGGSRFSEHHRVSLNQNMIQSNPIVSEQPRRWIGRRANLYLHTVDENGNLNSKANAELVFPGRIDALGDDPGGRTVLKMKHLLSEVGSTVIGGNRWAATVTEGVYLKAGTRVKAFEIEKSTVTKVANDLVVVASGAAGTNQINAGHYSLNEICQFLNAWCGGETAAARLEGRYSWISPAETGDGLRTVIDWQIVRATSELVSFFFDLPNVIAGMLGLAPNEGVFLGGITRWDPKKMAKPNTQHRAVGEHIPFRTAVFSKSTGAGGSLPSFRMLCENERGEFIDQYDTLPAIIKGGLDSSLDWGLFLVDEKLLIQASYTGNELRNCFITPFGQQQINDNQEPFYTLGRRADEDAGPVTVRQVFDMEGSFEQLMNIFHYNTGTAGYNHATYDTQAPGLGAGIPGGYLGDPFEKSIAALPRAQATMRLRFDEPKKLAELIGGELLARGAALVWKNGALMYQQWQSPTASLATLTLDESNKFRPSNSSDPMKVPTLETAAYARPYIKLDYNPDFAFGRETRYRASLGLIDHVGIDDGRNDAGAMTIKLAGTANEDDVKGLQADVLAKMTLRSRPSKFATRSISSRQFFGVAPLDVAIMTDRFARDPLTGMRYDPATDTGGLDERPCVIMRHTFDIGGQQPGRGQDDPRQFTGDVEVNYFDLNRCVPFSPAADVDETVSSGGFSAGYNNGTLQLACKAHAYSETSEPVDASNIPLLAVVEIVEKDPSNTAAPLKWTRTVNARSGNYLTVDSALGGWDPAKTYRITYSLFSSATALQKDTAFQADDATEMIESVDVPYLYGSTNEESTWSTNSTELTEFLVDQSYGDGRPLDVGNEKALINAINNTIDYKTAHHPLYMWSTYYKAGGLDSWHTVHFGRIHLGRETLNNAVYRYVSLAPWLRLDTTLGATTGYVRVTLSRELPKQATGSSTFGEFEWGEWYAQNTWTTTTTTEAFGTPYDFPAILKAQDWGMAYVLVETMNSYCRGLGRGGEGPRVLVL